MEYSHVGHMQSIHKVRKLYINHSTTSTNQSSTSSHPQYIYINEDTVVPVIHQDSVKHMEKLLENIAR